MASRMTGSAPVHSMTMSGSSACRDRRRGRSRRDRAPVSGFGPSLARSRTCTSKPRCTPISAASRPTGPAPVTSTTRGGQNGARAPMRLDVLPGLGDDAGRLQQHAERFQLRVELDREIRLDAELFGAVAVARLDAALGVLAIAAHVPFADGAGRARHRIGPAHDADHQIAALEAAAGRRARSTWPSDSWPRIRRCSPGGAQPYSPSIDFAVGAADAERQRAHQHGAVAWRRRRNVVKAERIGGAGLDGQARACGNPAVSWPPAALLTWLFFPVVQPSSSGDRCACAPYQWRARQIA